MQIMFGMLVMGTRKKNKKQRATTAARSSDEAAPEIGKKGPILNYSCTKAF